jgi:hypothetical protein
MYCPSAGYSQQDVPPPGAVVQVAAKYEAKSPSGVFNAYHLAEQYSRLNTTEKMHVSRRNQYI